LLEATNHPVCSDE
jgi:glycerol-3-phosphate dehydrogenase